MKSALRICSALLIALVLFLGYASWDSHHFLNSLAQSQFKFANHSFFENLSNNNIQVFSVQKDYQSHRINHFHIELIPVSVVQSNEQGVENYISHSNSTVRCFASHQHILGNMEVSSFLFNLLNEVDSEKFNIEQSKEKAQYFSEQYLFREKEYRFTRP